MGNKNTGLRNSDIARHFGVSRTRIGQLVKDGMPTSSILEAEAWCDANVRRRGKKFKTASSAEGLSSGGGESEKSDLPSCLESDALRNDVHGVLARAAKMEMDAFVEYDSNRKSDSVMATRAALKNWNDAMRVRMAAEREMLLWKKECGDLVDRSVGTDILRRKLTSLASLLDGIVVEGPRLNPTDPDHATGLLTEIANRLKAEVARA